MAKICLKAIDIAATSHFVAVPEGCSETSVREFKTFTADFYVLADWLKECGIQTIAMESIEQIIEVIWKII